MMSCTDVGIGVTVEMVMIWGYSANKSFSVCVGWELRLLIDNGIVLT
jgi:hypothetical protein